MASSSCCFLNCGCENFIITNNSTAIKGTIISTVSASSQLVTNIAISTPISIHADCTTIDTACCIELPMVSTSLVARESVSP